ncbi:alpha-mannosidase, partial [bacterium]
GGEAFEYYVQSYTRNSETRVSGKEPPRRAKTEKVSHAELVAIDPEIKAYAYDIDFTFELLKTVPENDPARSAILRALNECTNLWASEGRDSVGKARRLIRDTLSGLNGEMAHTIVPVGHAHLDTAWLWPIHITKKKMAHTTATQLGLLERYPEYTFAHSQASQYEWLEKDYPALFERVKEAVRKGKWEPTGSMWVEADCNLTGGESLVRQFLYGRRYFRDKLGYQTEDMWLPDVFGYSAALPQILAKFNIKYFLTQKISWNQTNKFPHHTFWWQGIDGTRVWTHFPPADTYNANCEPKEVIHSVRNFRDHGRSDQSLYVFGWGDGGGGPTERHLEFLRRGRLAPNYPEVATGKRAIDFFREAKAKSKDLMTWVGELYLELHRGTYTSQAATKRANRECEFLLRDAELLSAFAPGTYPSGELEAAWKLVLLNQFHDIIPGSSVREVYEDSDRDYAEVRTAAHRIIANTLKSIAEPFDTHAAANPVALFQNAIVSGQGQMPWTSESSPNSLIVQDETVPVQVVEAFGERSIVFPVPQAALGAVAVGDLSDAPAPRGRLKVSKRSIENAELSVKFDGNGNITSIQSLEDGTEYVEPGKLANLFQLLDDKPLFWSAWDVDVFAFETAQDLIRSESFEIVERGPVRAAVELVKRFGSSTIRQRISLGPWPGIRFDTEVDWHEEDKMLKVAFPINVNAARATYEIQFGNVERPTHVNTSWDQAKFEVCAQKWVDISEADGGVALINDGKYGHDTRGNVVRLSLLRSPKAPDPMCDMGVHRFSYQLLPHPGSYHHAQVVPHAYAFNAELRTAFLEPSAGEGVGALPPFVSVDGKNLVIEAVKKAEDNDDLIVRLYECHNTRGRALLSSATDFRSAYLCDLEETPIGDLESSPDGVVVEYRPFEIITVRLAR